MIKNLFSTLFNNLSETDAAEIYSKFGAFLMKDEKVVFGFKLVRDAVVFTDKRIIFIDKKGPSGKKAHVESIYIYSIIGVTCETPGLGFEDCDIVITYISSPHIRAQQIETKQLSLALAQRTDSAAVYKILQEQAYINYCAINDFGA